jgi:hypothetical protein
MRIRIASNKYGNRRVTINGSKFDSAAEAARFMELQLMQTSGQIIGWDWKRKRECPMVCARQQRIALWVCGIKVATYVADFVYLDRATKEIVVEDYKGFKTAAYKLKARLFYACFGFPITEVSRCRS